jgi:hypothetical protein
MKHLVSMSTYWIRKLFAVIEVFLKMAANVEGLAMGWIL